MEFEKRCKTVLPALRCKHIAHHYYLDDILQSFKLVHKIGAMCPTWLSAIIELWYSAAPVTKLPRTPQVQI